MNALRLMNVLALLLILPWRAQAAEADFVAASRQAQLSQSGGSAGGSSAAAAALTTESFW